MAHNLGLVTPLSQTAAYPRDVPRLIIKEQHLRVWHPCVTMYLGKVSCILLGVRDQLHTFEVTTCDACKHTPVTPVLCRLLLLGQQCQSHRLLTLAVSSKLWQLGVWECVKQWPCVRWLLYAGTIQARSETPPVTAGAASMHRQLSRLASVPASVQHLPRSSEEGHVL